MLYACGTFPLDQANVMKNFYGGKNIITLCQSVAQLMKLSTFLKKCYFCMLFVE